MDGDLGSDDGADGPAIGQMGLQHQQSMGGKGIAGLYKQEEENKGDPQSLAH